MSDVSIFIDKTKIKNRLEKINETYRDRVSRGVAILAGNPALVCKRKGRGDTYEMQLIEQRTAFEAALYARQYFVKRNVPVSMNILFDHQKQWKIFLKDGDSIWEEDNAIITMDDLIQSIVTVYSNISIEYNYDLRDMQVIFEDKCRKQARKWLDNIRRSDQSYLIPALYSALVKIASSKIGGCSNLEERISCKGVAGQCMVDSNAYAGFGEENAGVFLGFWEQNPVRCDHNFIVGGQQIAQKYWNVRAEMINIIFKEPQLLPEPIEFKIVKNHQYQNGNDVNNAFSDRANAILALATT